MSRKTLKFFIITSLILLIIGVITQATKTTYMAETRHEKAVFPKLYNELASINQIDIKNQRFNYTISKGQEGWTVKELDEYPARMDAINDLLKEIALMQIKEEFSYNIPAFIKMQVMEKDALGQIVLSTTKEESIIDLIIGDRKIGVSGTVLGTYIRNKDSDTAYLASTIIDITGSPLTWVDTLILDIHASNINNVKSEKKSNTPNKNLFPLIKNLEFINVFNFNNIKEKELSNSITFTLNNKLVITIEVFNVNHDNLIRIIPKLESNVVSSQAENLFNYLNKRTHWLFKLNSEKTSLLKL